MVKVKKIRCDVSAQSPFVLFELFLPLSQSFSLATNGAKDVVVASPLDMKQPLPRGE
jgi:hypothetical protein